MKKVLFAGALFAFATINSFGAACVSGSTMAALQALGAGGCTVGSADQWTLNTWAFGSGGASQVGYPGDPTLGDITVSFQNLVSGGGAQGFSVSFGAGSGTNFFSAVSGSPNQSVDWKTIFVITGTPIASVFNSIDNQSTTGTGTISAQKILTDPTQQGNPILADSTATHTTNAGTSFDDHNFFNNQSHSSNQMGVVDRYILNSGNSGTASLSGYTNTFYAADPIGDIPEPVTFVLMGAGLVGVAVLRRRRSA